MFLKNLTIKGFKSFADTASLGLEPGVTVVVGPNGSGKSNVVDAIAWVLGAQALRGGGDERAQSGTGQPVAQCRMRQIREQIHVERRAFAHGFRHGVNPAALNAALGNHHLTA